MGGEGGASDAELLDVVGLALDVPLMKNPIDVHCGLGSILEEGGEANVIVGCCGGIIGGGVHFFAEFLIFPLDGCAVVKSEEIGWVGWWGGAVGWDEVGIFDVC